MNPQLKRYSKRNMMIKWDNKFGVIEIKCKHLKENKCSNPSSLFLDYSKEFCRVCTQKEYNKCAYEAANKECFRLMPDSLRSCKGYENCQSYIEEKE